jgi:hypothetical protein
LASLPQVRVPSAAHVSSKQGQQVARTVSAKEDGAVGSAGAAALERVMPLVFSLFFHLGLVLVTVFLGTLVISAKPAETGAIPVPDVGLADGEEASNFTPPPGQQASGGRATFDSPYRKITPTNMRMLLPGVPGGNGEPAPGQGVIGLGPAVGDGGGPNGTGLGHGPGMGGGTDIFGPIRPTRASHVPRNIVYVVDRSGSMVNSFDRVRDEMFKSIGNLEPNLQLFHVILFSDGAPLEPADRRLVPPTGEYIRAVTQFLTSTAPRGQTDPLPALARAFDVLDKVPGTKVMYLLTDSQFPDGEKVLQLLRQRNAKKEVSIYPLLYGERTKEAEETMRKIAEENGHTTFRHIQPEE